MSLALPTGEAFLTRTQDALHPSQSCPLMGMYGAMQIAVSSWT